jgi:hypothetical protein
MDVADRDGLPVMDVAFWNGKSAAQRGNTNNKRL